MARSRSWIVAVAGGALALGPLVCTNTSGAMAAPQSWGPVESLSPAGAAAMLTEVAVDLSNTATVVWEQDWRIRVARRSAGGSFGKSVVLGRGTDPVVDTDSAGTVTVAWLTPRNQVVAVRRPAGGAWKQPVALSAAATDEDGITGARPPAIDVGPDGTTAVTWGYRASKRPRAGMKLQAAVRPPRGAWSTRTVAPGPIALVQYPVVAVDPHGAVDVAWADVQGAKVVHKHPVGGFGGTILLGAGGRDVDLASGYAWPQRSVVAWAQPVEGRGRLVQVARRAPRGWTMVGIASPGGIRARDVQVEYVDADHLVVAWSRADGTIESRFRGAQGWTPPEVLADAAEGRPVSGLVMASSVTGDAALAWVHVELGEEDLTSLRVTGRANVGGWSPPSEVRPEAPGGVVDFDVAHGPGAGKPGDIVAVWADDDGPGPAAFVVMTRTFVW